jgi:hypothetical protein
MRPSTQALANPCQTSPRRHICAWCHRDLGALPHDSEFDSYGICTDCVTRHFTHLYMPESETEIGRPVASCSEPTLTARTVGAPSLVARELAL